jgi:hypothetical protein
MAIRPGSEPVYRAVAFWADHCLVRAESVLGAAPLWTPVFCEHLNAGFAENLLEDDRSFLDKLLEQLEFSPPEVKRLAAEMLWLMMLFPSNVTYRAKLNLVSTVYGWSGEPLRTHPLVEALHPGVGSTGQAYNQHRWRELALLVRAMVVWGELDVGARVDLVSNPWKFAAWLDSIPDAKNRQIRNILLHLLFPRDFERISSFGHKRLIVRNFAKAFSVAVPRERESLPVDAFDRPLLEIRRRLEKMHPGRAIDFYDEEIEARWRPPSRRKDGGTDTPPGGDPTALEKRLAPDVRDVVLGHLALVSAIPELRARPTLGLMASALMRSLAADRRDTARGLWELIKRALPDDAVSVLVLFHLPYERIPDWAPPTSPPVDFTGVLGSGPGEEVRPILERADDCARQVTGNPAPGVSIRHLVGALLRPGPDNEAKRAIAERGFPLDRVRAGVMSFVQSTLAADDLEAWCEYLDVTLPPPVLPRPGFARDYVDPEEKELGPDHLDVDADVQALARLLCAESVKPPLSVGLFADWGTGKSTFMQRLKWNIGVLSSRAEAARKQGLPTAYETGVVSIWFNAWHYMDANLWASLVTRIFDQLARHFSGDPDKAALEEARKRLYARLVTSQGLLAEAERRRSLVQAEVATAGERVDAARRRQEGIGRRIARARDVAAGVWNAIAEEPAAPAVDGTAPPASAGAAARGVSPAAGGEGAADAGTAPKDAVEAEAEKAVDAALAKAAGEVRQAVGTAARELGLREADASIAEIRGALAQMRGMWGNLSASAEILSRRKGFLRGLALPLLAGIAVAALVLGAIRYFDLNVREWVNAAAGLVISLAPFVSVLAASAARVRRVLERADAEIQASTARAGSEADALQRELDRVKQAEAEAERDRMQAEQRVREIESEIEDIRAGRRLEQFIRDRAGSDDYRRHLGIIATIREDFERLQTLLDDVRRESEAPVPPADAAGAQPPAPGAPAIRRIILYIDDLDRCPEGRVVEVLQAVHLLLAFPLFVVVVGVDPRWLLRAVESQYEHLLTSQRQTARAGLPMDEDLHWASTPQNYLEKIFQIPFTLEPMNEAGFGQLLGSLVTVRAAIPAVAPVPPQGGTPTPPETDEAEETETGSGLDEQWLDDESPEEEEPDEQGDDDAGLDPPGLEVEAWELKYLSGLAPLIGSPRMAKRFANVYRFIRASLAGPALEKFSGTDQQPGEFRAVGLLLALLTGFPGEAVELFRRLLADPAAANQGWPDFVRRVAGDPAASHPAADGGTLPARRWERLLAALEQVENGAGVAREMEPYRAWAPRVARFSFQTGQILARRAPSAGTQHQTHAAAPQSPDGTHAENQRGRESEA